MRSQTQMSSIALSRQLNRISPALMAVLAIAILCGMDGFLKELTGRYSSLQVTFMRFAPSALFGAILFFAWRTPTPSRGSVVGNIQRGFLFLIASALFIHAVSRAPLTQVFAISYIAPVLAALLAMPVLGEKPDGRVALSLTLGFIGVLVAIGGVELSGGGGQLEGALAALGSSVCYAFVLVYLRRQAMSDPPITIALFQSLVPALVIGAFFIGANSLAPGSAAAAAWSPIAWSDLPTMALIGLLSIIGHMGMAHAFARAEASRLAPVEYSSFVWAALIGLIWFAEIPTLATMIGAAMIVAACFLIKR
jgi:drug/metabolite transporter (DMT)-like permease